MESIKQLAAIVSKISHLTDAGEYGAVGKANQMPAINRRRMEAVSISVNTSGYSHEAGQSMVEAARAIRAELAARNEQQGQAERLAALKAIASELESLRAILPAVAAKAAVETGIVARSIAELSKGGDA